MHDEDQPLEVRNDKGCEKLNFLEKIGLIGYIGLVGLTDVDKIMIMEGIVGIVFFISLFICWMVFLFGKELLNEK